MSTEESKAVARRYFERFHNGREHGILVDIVAPDLVEATQRVTEMVLRAFPDYHVSVEDQVAEEDKVATVWSASGTHRGDWESPAGSIPATGRRVTWQATTTFRVSDGKISEVIASSWDHLGILQQLGAVDVTEPRTGA